MPACVKVVFLGAARAGKTSLIQRYVSDEAPGEEYEQTVGAWYHPKILSVFGSTVRLDIWDMSGPERYAILAPMFWKGAHVVVLVYDVTDKDHSYERALIWLDQLKEAGYKAAVVMLATKCDLPLVDHKVEAERVKVLEQDTMVAFVAETSAVSAQGLDTIFLKIAEIGLKYFVYEDSHEAAGHAPEWVPDSSSKRCSRCYVEFTFATRRHHCRSCGFIFCNSCSSKKLPLPQFNIKKPVRVCVPCYDQDQKLRANANRKSQMPFVTTEAAIPMPMEKTSSSQLLVPPSGEL